MLDVPERTESEPHSEARFIRQQMAGLAGLIDQIRAASERDDEHRAVLREMEQSHRLLERRLAQIER